MKENLNEKLAKILEEQNKLFKSLKNVLPVLQEAQENLKKVNDITGATKRANDIREEIKLKGWNTISKIYNPEKNKKDPAAAPLFELYKYIYEDMVRKGEIKTNSNSKPDVA